MMCVRRMLGLALAIVFATQSAWAQTTGACAGDDETLSALTAKIEAGFARERPRAQAWWYGWMGYAVVEGAIGGIFYARADTRLDRDLWLVTWVGSAALLVELVAFPMVAAYANARLAQLARSTPVQRCAAFAHAKHFLIRAAEVEREGTGWLSHLLGVGWGLGTTAYLIGRNYDGSESVRSSHNRRVLWESALDLVWTLAITEAAIWTQPTDSVRNEERERRVLMLRVSPGWLGLALRL